VFCEGVHGQPSGNYLITTVVRPGQGGLINPAGLTVDPAGNLYLADNSGNRVLKVAPQGMISTLAGTGTPGFSGDGGLAVSAELDGPVGLAIDAAGDLYIADSGNARVRKINAQGVITTVAGGGDKYGLIDGISATSAGLGTPVAVAVSSDGSLYISDRSGYPFGGVRKVSPQGIITTATKTETVCPTALALDSSDNLYVSQTAYTPSNTCTSRQVFATFVDKVTPQGIEVTQQYPFGSCLIGPGIEVGLAIDKAGTLYVAEPEHHVICAVANDGTSAIVAGAGITGSGGDGGPATLAQIGSISPVDYLVTGIAVDASRNVFFADNGAIRELIPRPQLTGTCAYSIDQGAQSFGATGGNSSLGLLTSALNCPWLAESTVDWITIAPAGVQTGTGVVNLMVAPNPNSASRIGTVWIGGKGLTIRQDGLTCSFTVSPKSIAVPPAGVTGATISVTANAPDCQWTATAGASWMLVGGGGSGAGSGSVTYTVGVNAGRLRTGTIAVAGQIVYVNQAAAGGSTSSLTSVGALVNAASGRATVSPGDFITIYGQNLSDTITDWGSAITNGKLPTSLGGVQVLINGKKAFINYVQPTQVNAIAPQDTASGLIEVDVITNYGTVPVSVTMTPISPGLFTYIFQGTTYADAVFNSDGTSVGAVGARNGVSSRPAQPGDLVQLFATGFGATNPPYPAGQVLTAAYPIADLSTVNVQIGGVSATVLYAGMTYPGVFQINMQVPSGVPTGDQPLTLEVAGQSSQANVYLTFGGN
jgi:uncharacterized protein (TIGR03437 family)